MHLVMLRLRNCSKIGQVLRSARSTKNKWGKLKEDFKTWKKLMKKEIGNRLGPCEEDIFL